MTKSLFIIPCSSKKNTPNSKNQFDLKNISFNDELGDYRKKIIERLENTNTHLRNNNRQSKLILKQKIDFSKNLEAKILYSNGRLYKAAMSDKWKQEEAERVYIISALFGLVKASDWLPYYDLAMGDMLDSSFRPIDFWSGKLDSLINKICIENQMHDLLSNTYRKCLINVSNNFVIPNVKWKDKYGVHKGKWLLENIN